MLDEFLNDLSCFFMLLRVFVCSAFLSTECFCRIRITHGLIIFQFGVARIDTNTLDT